MRQIACSVLVALSLAVGLDAQQPAPVQANSNDEVTLTGCVIKGDGGYLLASAAEPVWSRPPQASTAPSTPASATTIAGRTFYWLDDDGDLEDHAGRRVEVIGKLEDEIDRGQISVERERGLIEIEFKAEGERKITVKVPETPSAVGTAGVSDREADYRVVIRKIDVKSVKAVASSCQ